MSDDTFVLDVDQAREIKHAAKRNGLTNADLKTLSSGDNFAKILPFLRGRAEIVVKSSLELVKTVSLPALPRFVARDHFKVDKSDGAKVKIAHIWDGFAPFLDLVEKKTDAAEIDVSKLTKNMLDKQILEELGGKARIKLSQFHAMLAAQRDGEEGPLLVNGYANLAYIEGFDNLVVDAYWYADYGGWYVYARRVGDPHRRRAGPQVLSRN